ncbi:hypothetical protein PTMSG1_05268 [Pyrenophora teres f. maculata]|nr:hypothetical protein PTMSG1_05268 [Pyrenophora teres f. maculata]
MPPRSSNPVVVFALAPNTANIEVRVSILKAYIPLFSYIQHTSHVPTAPISLPNTSPSTLKSLIRWLNADEAPPHLSAADFPLILKLWVLARSLGLWQFQNACLRLGIAAMQWRYSICEIDTVKWVYENTDLGSPLRDYVIKIFCQRGAPVEKGVFSKEVGELGILRDASSWLWELEKVRKAFHNKTAVEPDWREEAYPLPEALVFDETGVVLPDMHFVKAEGAFWGAEAVAKQLGLC